MPGAGGVGWEGAGGWAEGGFVSLAFGHHVRKGRRVDARTTYWERVVVAGGKGFGSGQAEQQMRRGWKPEEPTSPRDYTPTQGLENEDLELDTRANEKDRGWKPSEPTSPRDYTPDA